MRLIISFEHLKPNKHKKNSYEKDLISNCFLFIPFVR